MCRHHLPLSVVEDLAPGTKYLLGIIEALLRVTVQGALEKGDQPLTDCRLELFRCQYQCGLREGRIRLAIAPARQHTGGHLIERHASGITLGRLVPARRLPAGQKRLQIRDGADVDVLRWRPGERKVEQDELQPLPADPHRDVVWLDVTMRDASTF